MNSTQIFIIGIGSLIVTILGAVMAIRKLGPEINKLQVDTSQSLVAMARENAELHRTDAAELRLRNQALDDRITEYAEKLGFALADIEELKKKAATVDRLSGENARLRRERNRALTEVAELRSKVGRLEQRIQTLEGE